MNTPSLILIGSVVFARPVVLATLLARLAPDLPMFTIADHSGQFILQEKQADNPAFACLKLLLGNVARILA